jgi:hypothetical protein
MPSPDLPTPPRPDPHLPDLSTMWAHLTAPENAAFGIALILLLALFALQLVGLLLGSELFAWMDSAVPELPELDLDLEVDVQAAASAGSGGFVDHLFAFLNLGRVPLIISLLAFLFFFSCIGYNLQFVLREMGLPLMPLLGASAISFAVSLPLLRLSNAGLARVLPKDESAAVSPDTFVGRVAVVTLGTVTAQRQSEARLTGPRGRTHHVQVIADSEGMEFHQGDEVLLVSRQGPRYAVIPVENPRLHPDTFARKP